MNQFFDARDPADLNNVLDPALGGVDVPAIYKEGAVFADVTYHFSPAFDIELGVRETHIWQNSQVNTYCCVLFGPDTAYAALKLGFKSALPVPRINLDVAVFDIECKDIQILSLVDSPSGPPGQINSDRIPGSWPPRAGDWRAAAR